jgi:malonate decarboxylase beta subunit
MENYEFRFAMIQKLPAKTPVTVGIAGSGNLEVIVRPRTDDTDTVFQVTTPVGGFRETWLEALERFVEEYPFSSLTYIINDAGASPPAVSLRLRQAIEAYHVGYKTGHDYLELDARARIYSLVDEHRFDEFLVGEDCSSPNLAALNIQTGRDDGIVIGIATMAQQKIAIAAQQKEFIGGSVGEVHGAKLIGLIRYAIKNKLDAIILLIDTGGVRLQEANVGEIEISEIIQALLDARMAGIKTIGVVCGDNGAYGGMSITTGCLDYVIVNRVARIGVSGAEVIQAVKGIEGFDASDRSLMWRVYGGRTRYMQKAVQAYVSNQISDIQKCIVDALSTLNTSDLLTVDNAKKRHKQLRHRVKSAKDAVEQGAWLTKYGHGIKDTIFNTSDAEFIKTVNKGDKTWP